MDDERFVEVDKDYRRQVRKVYYLREEDFVPVYSPGGNTVAKSALDQYNNYLEEVEELIAQLMDEKTRAAARATLQSRAAAAKEKTAINKAKLDSDRKRMAETIQREKEEILEAADRRHREEKMRRAEQLQARNAMEVEVASGKSSVIDAQRKLRMKLQEPVTASKEYVPQLQPAYHQPAMVQPLDAAKRKEKDKLMQLSIYAKREGYEDDSQLMRVVCAAGGYDVEIWRVRYSLEALCSDGLNFLLQPG